SASSTIQARVSLAFNEGACSTGQSRQESFQTTEQETLRRRHLRLLFLQLLDVLAKPSKFELRNLSHGFVQQLDNRTRHDPASVSIQGNRIVQPRALLGRLR